MIKGVTPTEITQIEEEFIKEDMPREKIRRLCDVHLTVLRKTLEGEKRLL